jgi:hypothetical protein
VTTWDGAYHWHTDETIYAVDAIKLRENGRKESGDYWCHKSCYNRQPRDGIRLFARNHATTPNFWKGSGNFTKINDCEFNQLQIERKESTRYSQYYHDLRSWLDTDEAKQKLGFSTFSENKAHKYSDFILLATASKDVTWTEMEIIVVHKNRKRVPQTNNYIRIDLSQWKIEHILNFEGYGKRKIIEEFEQLIEKVAFNSLYFESIDNKIDPFIEELKSRTNRIEPKQFQQMFDYNNYQIKKTRESLETLHKSLPKLLRVFSYWYDMLQGFVHYTSTKDIDDFKGDGKSLRLLDEFLDSITLTPKSVLIGFEDYKAWFQAIEIKSPRTLSFTINLNMLSPSYSFAYDRRRLWSTPENARLWSPEESKILQQFVQPRGFFYLELERLQDACVMETNAHIELKNMIGEISKKLLDLELSVGFRNIKITKLLRIDSLENFEIVYNHVMKAQKN